MDGSLPTVPPVALCRIAREGRAVHLARLAVEKVPLRAARDIRREREREEARQLREKKRSAAAPVSSARRQRPVVPSRPAKTKTPGKKMKKTAAGSSSSSGGTPPLPKGMTSPPIPARGKTRAKQRGKKTPEKPRGGSRVRYERDI